MPAPSEQFTWKKTWPDRARSCSTCGKDLRVEDVGEHRAVYDLDRGRIVQEFLWCKEHRGGRSSHA